MWPPWAEGEDENLWDIDKRRKPEGAHEEEQGIETEATPEEEAEGRKEETKEDPTPRPTTREEETGQGERSQEQER